MDPSPSDTTFDAMAGAVRDKRFLFVHANQMLLALGERALADWSPFAASWNRLELDAYMADGGRYRRRRYATVSARAGSRELGSKRTVRTTSASSTTA